VSGAADVAVVGGGPAGLATAALLALRGVRVVLFERGEYDSPRAGEALGAEARSLLQAIGSWGEVSSAAGLAVPFRGVHSAWGGEELVWRSSITHPLGEGLHVDRARFDALLAGFAERAGARVRLGSGRCVVARTESGFQVRPSRGASVEARFFVDASGRGAPASSSGVHGARWLAMDRQVATIARAEARPGVAGDTELLLESTEDGWWYAAPQPGGGLVVVLVTDADLVPAGPRASLHERFAGALARTRHVQDRIETASLAEPPHVVRAESGCLLPDRGAWFRAVGDAAVAYDPLSGSGVAQALRSAFDAAPEIEAALGGAAPPPPRPGPPESFLSYLERRAAYYRIETRWPNAPFWARRRAGEVASSSIHLPPTALLHRASANATRAELAPAEALLPPRAISRVLDALASPRPAHEAMRILRDAAPLGDRRLLVGLQILVDLGVVRAENGARGS
jgi:flavin-dependent dehydrogenase